MIDRPDATRNNDDALASLNRLIDLFGRDCLPGNNVKHGPDTGNGNPVITGNFDIHDRIALRCGQSRPAEQQAGNHQETKIHN